MTENVKVFLGVVIIIVLLVSIALVVDYVVDEASAVYEIQCREPNIRIVGTDYHNTDGGQMAITHIETGQRTFVGSAGCTATKVGDLRNWADQ